MKTILPQTRIEIDGQKSPSPAVINWNPDIQEVQLQTVKTACIKSIELDVMCQGNLLDNGYSVSVKLPVPDQRSNAPTSMVVEKESKKVVIIL